jgi:hypothetical protein
MSWSINAKGKKPDVAEKLNSSRTAELSHVQGKEREIADKAVDLALAVVEATDEEKYQINVAMYGSASFDSAGKQTGQAIGVTIGLEWIEKTSG